MTIAVIMTEKGLTPIRLVGTKSPQILITVVCLYHFLSLIQR